MKMEKKPKGVPAKEGKSDALSDNGSRVVSLKPFDPPRNADAASLPGHVTVNAAKIDADGSRLAIATSDGVVRIVGIQFPDITYKIAELIMEDRDEGHGNVWDVAWGVTEAFGSVLASCSEDRKIRIWREKGEEWIKWLEWTCEGKAGNSLHWGPTCEGKLTLAVGCSDGSVVIFSHEDSPEDKIGWTVQSIASAHSEGVTVIKWAPNRRLTKEPKPDPLLITGGADSLIKMWIPKSDAGDQGTWERESKLEGHQDWISDLVWAPCVGIRLRHLLASAGRDKKVILWNQPSPSAVWVPVLLTQTYETPWSLSFSLTGHLLSVSEADGRATLWRENQGNWEEVRFCKKVRTYQEKMRAAYASQIPGKALDTSIVPTEASDARNLYGDEVAPKPDEYPQRWPTNYDPYADYYAYYGRESDRQPRFYDDRNQSLTDTRSYSSQRYPYYAYPVENSASETYPSRKPSETRGSKYDYDDRDYHEPRSSTRDRSYRSYRDERY